MANGKPRFSWMTHAYVWLFMTLLGITPVLIALWYRRIEPVTTPEWAVAIASVVAIQLLFLYSQWRCSSEKLSFWDGLLFVSASMSTGWMYFSMAFVFPALMAVFVASICLSAYCDLVPSSKTAAYRFHKLIFLFYQNRMRQ